MAAHEGSTDPDRAKLIAAAQAAASWARARRARWTDAPLPNDTLDRAPAPEPIAFVPAAIVAPAVESPAEQPPPAARAPHRQGPSVVVRLTGSARDLAPAVGRWTLRLAAVAALTVLGVAAGRYVLGKVSGTISQVATPQPSPSPAPAAPAARKATGGLHITSTPAGAHVLVDGKARGVTPLTLADVPVGAHALELTGEAGSVRRSVTVAAGQTVSVEEAIFAGALVVFAPFDVSITEGGRGLRLDDRNQVMLPPGRHEIRLTNRSLAFDVVRQVEVKPGEMATLSVAPPKSSMTVTATEAAEVWIDGARAGDAPLAGFAVDVGTHEIVVKRASGGERRFTVTVTTKPSTLNVDFSGRP